MRKSRRQTGQLNLYEFVPITYGPTVTVAEFLHCCNDEYWRKEFKREYDCMERFRTCEDKECCICTVRGDCGDSSEEDCYDFIEYPDSDDVDETDADVDNLTNVNALDDSNKKEKSKSDGCSMLFV